MKQCISFGSFFKQKSFFVQALRLIAVSSEEFLRNTIMPSLKQMAGCTPIPSTPVVHIVPTPNIWHKPLPQKMLSGGGPNSSCQYNNGHKCCLSGKVLTIKPYLFWDCNHK